VAKITEVVTEKLFFFFLCVAKITKGFFLLYSIFSLFISFGGDNLDNDECCCGKENKN
jgi:hypothetical protein